MPSFLSIPAGDRQFFQAASRATFANPFSEERRELDQQLLGSFVGDPEIAERLSAALAVRLTKLERQGAADFRRYAGEEREVMRSVFLFESFHQTCAAFDQLILEQTRVGDRSCPVPFAREALAALERRGFTHEEAVRVFGIFYQLRRAFFFVQRGLIGQSACMKEFRRHLWNSVVTHDIRWYDRYLWSRMEDFSTLLLGETGTGKGAAAAAIGRSGYIPFEERRGTFTESFTSGFVALNLSQFPEALIESELFGHKKGAFTGAIEAHQGVLARCSPHGAIFLDEIGDVSVPVQIKLLQVLQERTFSPVGSHEKARFRGRVIGATNKPVAALRQSKLFRDDFFYRLSSDIITVPPLRQRIAESPAELGLLVEHLVTRMAGQTAPELVTLVGDVLARGVGPHYAWPGNVRELEQAVRRILLTRRYDGDRDGVALDLRTELIARLDSGTLDADQLLHAYCTLLHQRHGTIEEVARRANLDRRTVKRYLAAGSTSSPGS